MSSCVPEGFVDFVSLSHAIFFGENRLRMTILNTYMAKVKLHDCM